MPIDMPLADHDPEEFQLKPATSRTTKRTADGTPINRSLHLTETDSDRHGPKFPEIRVDSTETNNSFGLVGQPNAPLDHARRQEHAQELYNRSAGLYPKERHYPTLEAMQRLSKLFGYATILAVFPYLTFRFLWILLTTEDGVLQELGQFSMFAVPLLFAMVGLIGVLFTASEGIRLAIDLQDNTLRIANRAGRRKE
ncbi:hypothetical protein [Rhodopirellula bahusiensis]